MEERLQKLIARAGIASRRAAEELIENGFVTVNGQKAKVGDKADPQTDDIRVQGKRLRFDEKLRYIILYKKRGVVSTTEAQEDQTTVLDVVNVSERVYPVGRLDVDSDGLVLLTNDGDLTYRITHPRYGCEKTYKVIVAGIPPAERLDYWRRGVMLDGEKTAPAKIRVMHTDEDGTELRVVMHEGKKRQIRRIAEQIGHPVIRLTRTHIGPIDLGRMRPGEYRDLSQREVELLRASTQTTPVKKRRPNPKKRDE